LAKCQELCDRRGYDVVGVAEDLDVSAGSTSPFDRPQLGDWLTNRLGEFDALVFFRADRIVRRLFDLADLIRWAREHSVTMVSATESYFDLSPEFGDMIALLIAKVAEMELSAISERNASAFRHNFAAGKYRGGIPPWGYLPDKSTGTWRHVQDPAQVAVINEVAERVLTGEPLRAIAHDLTARAVLTPKDRFAQTQGREPKGYQWHSSPLKRSLTSQTLLGHAVTREPLTDAQGRVQRDAKGKKLFSPESIVRAEDGSPVVRCEPILTREVFDRLGVELADRENRKEPTKQSSGLLLRVVFCRVCDRPAYRQKGGAGRSPRYRCASAQYKDSCGNRSIPLADADEFVSQHLLELLGDSERLIRVWDSGSDHSAELTEINETLTDLTGYSEPASTALAPRSVPRWTPV
jgi:site-specific DNA recombinase